MKYFRCSLGLLLFSGTAMAQSNINDLLASGLNDAKRFTTDYLSPVSEGAIYSLSGSWLNTATANPPGGFEISLVGSLAPFKRKEDKKAFVLRADDYENLRFQDGSASRPVASALGDISGVRVVVEDQNGLFSESFELPSGLASENIHFIPAGYLQGSVGLIRGTEVKARFLPRIKTDEVSLGLYGFGLLHEFTSHLPDERVFPVSISGFVGYTRLSATYDFTNTQFIDGENQRIDTRVGSWSFQAAVATKLPVFNFYGALGYVSGKSETDVLGTYRVTSGPFQTTYTDPFSITKKAGGPTGTLGGRLSLGFFRLHAEYTLAEFNLFTAGLHFGFR